jgi:transglutaminase-like putative cysteine protease
MKIKYKFHFTIKNLTMNKINLAATLMLLSFLSVNGQEYLKEFKKIAKDEIELKQYSKDTEAEAVVLFDIGKSYFERTENPFDVIYERRTRIKILSEAGLKWAEVEIPFYLEGDIQEQVTNIEAYTYNYENGLIDRVQFDVANTYNEKVNKFWNVKKLALPNVKVGSIIEYRYKVRSQYIFNLRDWEFQWKIPVIYSEYEVHMIPFYDYSWLLQGAAKFTSQSSYLEDGVPKQFGPVTYNNMIYKYIMKDVPAFKSEEFISSPKDYLITIDFQLSEVKPIDGGNIKIMSTWEEIIKELQKHKDFGKYILKSEKLAEDLIDIENLTPKKSKEKFDFVMNYVKSNYNWNQNNGEYATKTANKFVEEKHGNSADVNLFTIGLLKSLNIDSRPVIISTRDNGKVKYKYAFTHYFNYVIILANIDGENILTDATEIHGLNNRIPSRCINDMGLVIQDDKVEWVGLECKQTSDLRTNIIMDIIKDDSISTSVIKTATEYDAFSYRNNFTDDIEKVLKKLKNDNYAIIDSTVKVENQIEKEKPYILKYKLTNRPEVVNDKLYISPFLKETLSENPLKQNQRTYPIDMTYPVRRLYSSTISVPDGYKIEYMPATKKIDNQLFSLNYSTFYNGKQLVVYFDYCFKCSIYQPADYSKIQSYFNEIVKMGDEKIVLSRE